MGGMSRKERLDQLHRSRVCVGGKRRLLHLPNRIAQQRQWKREGEINITRERSTREKPTRAIVIFVVVVVAFLYQKAQERRVVYLRIVFWHEMGDNLMKSRAGRSIESTPPPTLSLSHLSKDAPFHKLARPPPPLPVFSSSLLSSIIFLLSVDRPLSYSQSFV
jgi:hypothetical protein